eukprot:7872584-Alexandrium_andersonii.AAC.1
MDTNDTHTRTRKQASKARGATTSCNAKQRGCGTCVPLPSARAARALPTPSRCCQSGPVPLARGEDEGAAVARASRFRVGAGAGV